MFRFLPDVSNFFKDSYCLFEFRQFVFKVTFSLLCLQAGVLRDAISYFRVPPWN